MSWHICASYDEVKNDAFFHTEPLVHSLCNVALSWHHILLVDVTMMSKATFTAVWGYAAAEPVELPPNVTRTDSSSTADSGTHEGSK